MKSPDVLPAVIVRVAGIEAAVGLLFTIVTVIPEPVAGPLRVTVPVASVPPITVDGAIATDATPMMVTVKFAVLVEVP